MKQRFLYLGLLCVAACFGTPNAFSQTFPKTSSLEKSSLADIDSAKNKIQNNVDIQHQSQIKPLSIEYDTPFGSSLWIPSSLNVLKLADDIYLLSGESETGAAQFVRVDANGAHDVQTIHPHAQVACTEAYQDGFRIAVIEREQSRFQLVVRTYDANGKHIKNDDWRVTTRGFTPDPGSHCALLSRRALLAVGTRPRNLHVPTRGLAKVESRALNFYNDTNPHAPDIIGFNPKKNNEIIVQYIQRENDKPQARQAAWKLSPDMTVTSLRQNDFIAADGEVTKKGCIIKAEETRCFDIEVRGVKALGDLCPGCMALQTHDASFLVTSSPIRLHAIAANIQLLPVSLSDRWLGFTPDEILPDKAVPLTWFRQPNFDE